VIRSIAIALLVLSGAPAPPPAHFEIPQTSFLIDEVVPIVVSGLAPQSHVTIRLHNNDWSSSADFVADTNGVVDLTRTADPMELFWSARRNGSPPAPAPAQPNSKNPPPEPWELSAEVDGKVAAATTILRRVVSLDVTVSLVRERGLVGVFYRPAGEGKHPAVLVLGGSGGGLPPASAQPGGLASRGYAVLSLAYFGVEGLPPSLTNIPLEYFNTALDWLAAQPSVDASRIGVLGTSRGGELALLLASINPQRIRSVVAYVPSSVVVGGCCNQRDEPSWTINGRPIAWASPRFRDDFISRSRAAIHVEDIGGAILLISGKDDKVWPSASMSDEIVARLRHNHFAHPFEHLSYDNAGHGIGRPYTSTMEINSTHHPLTGHLLPLGGTPAGTAHARADSWQHVLAFLKATL
jgi:dienelactone hydrolase